MNGIAALRISDLELVQHQLAMNIVEVERAVGRAMGCQLLNAPFINVTRIENSGSTELLRQIDDLGSDVVNVFLVEALRGQLVDAERFKNSANCMLLRLTLPLELLLEHRPNLFNAPADVLQGLGAIFQEQDFDNDLLQNHPR